MKAVLSLCWSHIPHFLNSHVAAVFSSTTKEHTYHDLDMYVFKILFGEVCLHFFYHIQFDGDMSVAPQNILVTVKQTIYLPKQSKK